MKKDNFDNDLSLVAFLKQNRPIAPPSALDLQAQIMAQVQAMPVAQSSKVNSLANFKIWFVGAAIATATIIASISTNRQMQPVLTEADNQTIEASLVRSWSITTDESEDFTSSYSLWNNQKSRYE